MVVYNLAYAIQIKQIQHFCCIQLKQCNAQIFSDAPSVYSEPHQIIPCPFISKNGRVEKKDVNETILDRGCPIMKWTVMENMLCSGIYAMMGGGPGYSLFENT